MNCEISIGNATSNNITGNTTPDAVIRDIQTGTWAKQVHAVRAATGEERDRLKKQLPAVTWSGTFTKRANAGLIKHSGLICADLDKLTNVQELHEMASKDPHVVAAFVSPSNNGLKLVFRTEDFSAVRAHVACHYSAKVDEAAKDVSRLCFVSYDPAAFYNPEAKPLDMRKDSGANESHLHQPSRIGAEKGNRNNTAFELACQCRDRGQTETEAQATVRDFAAKCNPPLPVTEADGCVRSAYSQPPRLPSVIELPDLIDAATFIAEPIEPPAELIEGILHKGSKLAFGGSSKSFKTWSLLDVAISVAAGADWLGRRTAKGKVLFLNFEIQSYAWQKRIVAVAKAKGIEIQPGMVKLWNLRGHAAGFKQIIPKIIQGCRTENFDLIVLDPIYKLYGGTDENAAGDVAELLNALERLATESGAAIAFGAHFAKGNASAKEAIDRISGSGVFARDPDSLLIFTKHETDDAFSVEPILRNFAPVEPFAVRWQFPLMRLADDLDPSKLKQAGGRKPEHSPADLLRLLPIGGLENKAWIETADENGISKRTFFRLRKTLETEGKIHASTVTGTWQPILKK